MVKKDACLGVLIDIPKYGRPLYVYGDGGWFPAGLGVLILCSNRAKMTKTNRIDCKT